MSDAGPLIALARIDLLFLLHELFTEVVVPTAVIDELRLREPKPGAEALAEATRHRWLRSMVPTDERPVAGLGVGESSAIRLALQLRCPLLVDERRGRIAARNHELTIIGTGRVLLDAKQRNLIDTVAGAVDALKATGYRLSDELCSRLLALAGEV